jgi:simple sugar transport system permease protein
MERSTERLRAAAPGAVAAVLALGVGALLILISGENPITGYHGLIDGALGDRYHIGETLVRAVPLALVALGTAPALRAGVFTVGAEGQMAVGALTSTAAILALDRAPAAVLLPLGVLAGAAGGAAWALLPALLRVRWRVNEILSTLLMNYLALELLTWLLRTHLRAGTSVATPQSRDLPDAALIPKLLSGTRLHWGAVVALVLAGALAWWIRSTGGFALDVYGARPALARRMGVADGTAVVGTMLVAGAAAGMAGWVQVAGVQGRLYTSVTGGIGFTGVLIAVLGALAPLGILAASLLFAVLSTGADGIQAATGTPASIATVIQAVLLLGAAVAIGIQRSRRVGTGGRLPRDEPVDPVEAAAAPLPTTSLVMPK